MEEIVRPNGQSMAISAIPSAMVCNLTENREGRSGPVGLESPILARIPGLGNVAWRLAAGLTRA